MESQRQLLRVLFMIIGGITFFLLVSYRPTNHTKVPRHTKVDSSQYYKAKIKTLQVKITQQQQLLKEASEKPKKRNF